MAERVELVGWLAASRPVRTSAGGWMRFLTLEDESGPFRVGGRVEEHLGACTLHAERIE